MTSRAAPTFKIIPTLRFPVFGDRACDGGDGVIELLTRGAWPFPDRSPVLASLSPVSIGTRAFNRGEHLSYEISDGASSIHALNAGLASHAARQLVVRGELAIAPCGFVLLAKPQQSARQSARRDVDVATEPRSAFALRPSPVPTGATYNCGVKYEYEPLASMS